MKISKRKLLMIVVVILSVLVGVLLVQNQRQAKDISNNGQSVKKLQDDLDIQQRIAKGNLDNAFAQEKVVIDPASSTVYLPEFRIKLPYDSISKTIAYSMRNDNGIGGASATDPPEADVTSTQYIAPENTTVVNCSAFVRLKIQDKPNPYSPNEKTNSIKLSNGKTLQVYEAVNQKECTATWSETIAPSAITAEFKKAQSY